jgi:ferrous iron transport protein A
MLGEGNEGVVITVSGGHGLVRKLSDLGFVPGTRVKVLSNSRGPILINVRDSRIAMGRGMAMKILVGEVGR